MNRSIEQLIQDPQNLLNSAFLALTYKVEVEVTGQDQRSWRYLRFMNASSYLSNDWWSPQNARNVIYALSKQSNLSEN